MFHLVLPRLSNDTPTLALFSLRIVRHLPREFATDRLRSCCGCGFEQVSDICVVTLNDFDKI